MKNQITQFIRGLFDSLGSINLALDVFRNKSTKNVLNILVVYNILICLSFSLFFQVLPTYFNITNKWAISIYKLLITTMWLVPHYIIGLIYNSYYTNKSISVFIHVYNPQNLKLKYQCYERYSKYLVNKGYYQVIVTFLTIETIIIAYIPYIGVLMDWILTSLIYSYYCWEYSWSSHKVPHPNRYSIFESNWYYYLGYGSLIGLIKINMGFFCYNYIIASIFPILSMNTLILFKVEDVIVNSKSVKFKIPLFYLPIRYANKVVTNISDYLKKYK